MAFDVILFTQKFEQTKHDNINRVLSQENSTHSHKKCAMSQS